MIMGKMERGLLGLFGAVMIMQFFAVTYADNSGSSEKPNVIFILTDDMGKGELGFYGNTIIRTPHLDRFAEDCLRFTNFHVAQSCSPTRAQLMSGRHEFYAGVTHTTSDREKLSPGLKLLPAYLKGAGYRTAMFGKWHLGGSRRAQVYYPHNRGFDTALSTGNQLKRFDPSLNHNGTMEPFKGYCVDVLFSECMKWVDANESENAPCFAYLATSAPHVPLDAPKEVTDLYADAPLSEKAKTYYAMISNIDMNFGKLMTWLDRKKGAARGTIVIFMTDNGHAISGCSQVGHDEYGFLKEGGLYNANMRGGKAQPWQGGTCVPFFIRWPGVIPQGRDDATLTSAMDLVPTLSEIAGVPCDDSGIQGISLLPNILGKPTKVPESRMLFSHKGRWHSSEFLDDYRYVYASVFTERYRLVWNKIQQIELYDYVADPQETNNIIHGHPELVATLKAKYDVWWEDSKKYMVNDLEQIETGNFCVRLQHGTPAQWIEKAQKRRK